LAWIFVQLVGSAVELFILTGNLCELDEGRLALCTRQSQATTILHRAVIINEFHKGAQTSTTLRSFRSISTTGIYYYNNYTSSN